MKLSTVLAAGVGVMLTGLDHAVCRDFNYGAVLQPYQRKLLRGGQVEEPTRRTKGRRGAAKRIADRKAWNAGKR